jgi:hypothetical protein
MELSTAEKFILLILHPEKPRYIVPEQRRTAGLAGAVLLDLAMEERIDISDKRVKVKSQNTKLSAAHSIALRKIYQAKKEKKVKAWISHFTMWNRKIRMPLLDEMKKKRLIAIEKKRFLFIPYKRSRLLDRKKRDTLIREIREAILQKKAIDSEMSAILGLIEASKNHKVISNDREELKKIRAELKKILESDVISQGVIKVIREMQAAVTAAVASSTVAATAGSH